jgi:hypothetical protein
MRMKASKNLKAQILARKVVTGRPRISPRRQSMGVGEVQAIA